MFCCAVSHFIAVASSASKSLAVVSGSLVLALGFRIDSLSKLLERFSSRESGTSGAKAPSVAFDYDTAKAVPLTKQNL
jgi:hypothetical protein